jgi:hypothetical protein
VPIPTLATGAMTMARFIVRCEQYVEEIAYLSVEADSEAEAIDKVSRYNDNIGIDTWEDGDDIRDFAMRVLPDDEAILALDNAYPIDDDTAHTTEIVEGADRTLVKITIG